MDTVTLYIIVALALVVSIVKDRRKTVLALRKAWKAFEGILPQFLVVLVLIAMILAVLDTATISRLIGSRSGVWGILGASLIGAITLIPGFIAFPAAAALLAGGAGVVQIAAFVSSLMMVGIVTLPMEMQYFGRRVAITRNMLAYAFSLLAALFVGWVVAL
ncbi:MAG TPA: permease [bacterium]|nr:permease [bacterium]